MFYCMMVVSVYDHHTLKVALRNTTVTIFQNFYFGKKV